MNSSADEFTRSPGLRQDRKLRSLLQAFNAMAALLETDELQRRSLLADGSHELRTTCRMRFRSSS
jgi:signal transduction histidine kinase